MLERAIRTIVIISLWFLLLQGAMRRAILFIRKKEDFGSAIERSFNLSKSSDSIAHEHSEENGKEVESSEYWEDGTSLQRLSECSLETYNNEHGEVTGVAE